MARLKQHHQLNSRDGRAKLKARKEPYWHQIHPQLFLGYYKGPQGGRWLAREYVGGKYYRKRIGPADDHADADGETVLSFAQAQREAMAGVKPRNSANYTVADALDEYLADFEGRTPTETKRVADKRIRPQLGERPVDELTAEEIRGWQRGLLEPKNKRDRQRQEAEPAEWDRRRRATANRVLTVLKAALNHAYRNDRVTSSTAWTKVKPFERVDQPRRRYLTHTESVRFVNACDPDFRPLARAALLTGGRYGELVAMRVRDYNPDAGTAHFVDTKSGQDRHVPLTEEGVQLFEELTAGRKASAPMFVHEDGTLWGRNHQQRPTREACERAGIDPPISFHILRHTYGSLLAMKGVPLQVIAHAMGHADTRMTERHYAHLQPDHVSEAVRAALPNFGSGNGKVRQLRPRQAADS